MSGAFRKMLLTAAGNMILVMHLIILACITIHAAGDIIHKCDRNFYEKLEVAEQMIKSAKGKFTTNLQSTLPKDCQDLLNNGQKKSGVYSVWPMNRLISGSISVYCDMDTDGGGWTVIQRRGNFSRDKEYFYQDWKTYKKGFGKLEEDFWLGNDYIYALSNQKQYSIRFDLEDFDGIKRYAVYDTFWIEEESNKYALHVSGYYGNARDSFSDHNGMKFTTKDSDNDHNYYNCAQTHTGGWWFVNCYSVHLNAPYPEGKKVPLWKGIFWKHWTSDYESLKNTEMKIRRNPSTKKFID